MAIVVFTNESDATFNLKNYLLVLAKMHCNPTAVCYCENKQDENTHNMKSIKLLSGGKIVSKKNISTAINQAENNTFKINLTSAIIDSMVYKHFYKYVDILYQ